MDTRTDPPKPRLMKPKENPHWAGWSPYKGIPRFNLANPKSSAARSGDRSKEQSKDRRMKQSSKERTEEKDRDE
ncbi:unnamed protein product [Cuscuta campestris]|uniref:Uncharacterized protein n=1 Tax=Cuscuta campestris TaxID=132261 RepID=A0A484MY12_9ASTE|nr:unnamed protein product [Cuscuta campestris]